MNESTKQPIKMIPGDDTHLTMLMAPSNLNFFVGKDREDLLAYGRAAFEAGKAGRCLHQIQEPSAAEQAAWHAGLDEGRAQATGSVPNATSQHSTACLYGYALTRLGLTDTPQMRVLFWDAHEALEWDEKTDRYITPSAEGECGQCGHVQEPASSKAAPAAVSVPDAVTDEMVHAALRVQHPNMYREYLRHPANGPTIEAKTEKEIDTARKMIAAALAATPSAAAVPDRWTPSVENINALPEPFAWHWADGDKATNFTKSRDYASRFSGVEELYTEPQLRALLATATGLPAQAVEPHTDDVAVDALAALMKAKLAKQRDKGYGGWDTDCTRERLSELLRDHVDKGDPIDVANFCAFLSARGEGIAPAADAPSAFPAMTEELASILGLMCFQCISFAQALRAGGYSIKKRAEDEQAAVLHWMLGHYFRSGPDGWRAAASADMERLRESSAKEGGAA